MNGQAPAVAAGNDTGPVGAHISEVLRARARSMRRSAGGAHPCVAVAYERRARELERGADLVDAVLAPAPAAIARPSHAA
jgi:hypothetical protein